MDDNRERAYRDTKLCGMRDGNAPFPLSELKKHGQAWRSSFNPREGKALLSAALTPYYDLFNSSSFFAHVTLDYADPATRDIGERWNQIITEEFDYLLRSYEGFEFNMQAMLHDFIFFGKGFLLWPDNKDWQFKHIPCGRVLVPDDTDAFSGNLDVIVIRERLTEVKLWNWIRNKSQAVDMGYDVDEVVKAIESATTTQPDTAWDYQYYQQRMKDHDVSYSTTTPNVKVAHVYVREFDNTVTHAIVPEDQLRQYLKEGDDAEEEYLFIKRGQYEKFSSLISTFFLEVLDGSWNGMTGLGQDCYAAVEVKTRIINKMADNAFMRGDIIIQPNSAAAQNKISITMTGGLTILPADYTVHQSTIFGDMQGLILADQVLSQKLAQNTGVYKQAIEPRQKGNPPTARGEELRYQSQAVLSNSQVGRFYVQLDRHYAELYRRVVNETPYDDDSANMAKDFRDACKRRGVPLSAMKKVKCVKAFRALGNGSFVMRQEATEALGKVSQMFPESGKTKWLKDYVAVHSNQTTAERYVPEEAISQLPSDQQETAMLENVAIKIGGAGAVTWTPTQNSVIHLQAHLLAGSQAVASLQPQQGQQPQHMPDPAEVVTFMDAIGQHCAVHLDKLKGDPLHKREFQLLEQQWKKLGQLTDQLRGQIDAERRKAMQQQAEQQKAAQIAQSVQQGTDPQTQVKVAQAQVDIGIKKAKGAQSLKLKQESHDQKMALNDLSAAAKIQAENNKPS